MSDAVQVRRGDDWQAVLEALDEVVLLLNARYVITYASPSVKDRLGYTQEAVTGLALGDLVHPEDLRPALRHLAEVGVAGAVRHAMRVRRVDGTYLLLEFSLTRTGEESVGPGEVVVLCGRDGTTRMTLEDRLASVDQRHRTLLAALAEAVVFLDGQLRVEEVNEQAALLLGVGAHDLLGRRIFDVLDIWDENGRRLTPDTPFVQQLQASPGVQDVWRSVLRGDGQRVLVHCRWTPLAVGAQGRGYVLTMQDAVGARTSSSAALPQQRRQARTAAGLTPREHEVLERLADGQDAMEIAREFDLSVYSVRGHIKSLMRKLGVHSQLQAVVVAARRGIVDVVGERAAPTP